MIIQAFRYEFNKLGIKKVLLLFTIIAFLIIVFFALIPNNRENSYYDDLVEFCASNNIDINDITGRLCTINYCYDEHTNQFV